LRTKLEEVRRTVADGADKLTWSLTVRVPRRRPRESVRRNRRHEGSLRPGASEGHSRNRRTRHYDNVRLASEIAMQAGGDFIKTSTGKVSPAATMPVTLVMLEAIRDYFFATGIRIGMKPAGGHPHGQAGARLPRDGQGNPRRRLAQPQMFRFARARSSTTCSCKSPSRRTVIIKALTISRCLNFLDRINRMTGLFQKSTRQLPVSRRNPAQSCKPVSTSNNDLTGQIIGLAMKVHRTLGPGFLESRLSKNFAL